LDDVYNFKDAFDSLLLGQEMLEKLGADGRLRGRLFRGGKGSILHDWLPVLKGEHWKVALSDPRFDLLAWLSDETAKPVAPVDLARDWFRRRSPFVGQVRLAEAVQSGYLRGYEEWTLWDFVGRTARTSVDVEQLTAWRKQVAARYPRLTAWLAETQGAFYSQRGFGVDSYMQLDSDSYRAFLGRTVAELLHTVGGVLALAVKEAGANVVGRFRDAVLIEGKPPKQRAGLNGKLAAAFPGASFRIEVVKP
jgi:hypothetical protein